MHYELFGRRPTLAVVDAYCRAHGDIPELRPPDPAEVRTVNAIVNGKLDAVGIELWLRGGKRRHILSAKLLLIAYLSECDGSHAEFLRSNTGGIRALPLIGLAGAKGLVRALRGRLQIAWYGLI